MRRYKKQIARILILILLFSLCGCSRNQSAGGIAAPSDIVDSAADPAENDTPQADAPADDTEQPLSDPAPQPEDETPDQAESILTLVCENTWPEEESEEQRLRRERLQFFREYGGSIECKWNTVWSAGSGDLVCLENEMIFMKKTHRYFKSVYDLEPGKLEIMTDIYKRRAGDIEWTAMGLSSGSLLGSAGNHLFCVDKDNKLLRYTTASLSEPETMGTLSERLWKDMIDSFIYGDWAVLWFADEVLAVNLKTKELRREKPEGILYPRLSGDYLYYFQQPEKSNYYILRRKNLKTGKQEELFKSALRQNPYSAFLNGGRLYFVLGTSNGECAVYVYDPNKDTTQTLISYRTCANPATSVGMWDGNLYLSYKRDTYTVALLVYDPVTGKTLRDEAMDVSYIYSNANGLVYVDDREEDCAYVLISKRGERRFRKIYSNSVQCCIIGPKVVAAADSEDGFSAHFENGDWEVCNSLK